MSSSEGDMMTEGIVSSTFTSKKGRSRKRKPPDAFEPTRFLIWRGRGGTSRVTCGMGVCAHAAAVRVEPTRFVIWCVTGGAGA